MNNTKYLCVTKDWGESWIPKTKEILRVDTIRHIYIDASERTSLIYEYDSGKGEKFSMRESFDNERACLMRYEEVADYIGALNEWIEV